MVVEFDHNGSVGKNPALPMLLAVNAQIRRLQHDLGQAETMDIDPALRKLHQEGKFLLQACGDPSCKCMGRVGA